MLSGFQTDPDENQILSYTINPANKNIKFYWKNNKGENIKNIKNLKDWLSDKGDSLLFAMNGGMYKKDLSPQGLYIENGKMFSTLDTISKGYGNFYMQPNGVFYIQRDYTAVICKTEDFIINSDVLYATQSGPLLLINSKIHPRFNKNSKSLNIRNGVGILPNGHLLFAMSKTEINFYDFANFFRNYNCKYALYLDGFVSRTYLPAANWIQLDGNFGVIIAEIKKAKVIHTE